MSWFNRSDKTQRIGTLETSIAKLASEVVALKSIAEKTQTGVETLQTTIASLHVTCATCGERQDRRWEIRGIEHADLKKDLSELTELVRRNAEDIRILSASIERLATRQRERGD